MRFIFIAAFGLLPLWVAIGIVIFFAIHSDDSLTVTPWFIIFSIPACAVTLLIALASLKVHAYIEGDQSRKVLGATITLIGALSVVALVMWMYQVRQERRAIYINQESALVAMFLRNNEAVQHAVGDLTELSLISSAIPHSSWLPVRYEFSIHGAKPVTVIVEIDRQGKVPVFVLASMTSLPATRDIRMRK